MTDLSPPSAAAASAVPDTDPRDALSEFSAPPGRIVVHDPARTDAFDVLAGIPEEELKGRTLFSAHPERERFAADHEALADTLEQTGVEVVRLSELLVDGELWRHVHSNPNQVYTRDSTVTLPWLPGWYVAGAMRVPIRRPEVAVMSAALRTLGLQELFAAPADCYLEGGDVIPLVHDGRRALLVGFGPRTARESIDLLAERLMPWAVDEIVGVELPAWRMNLDGVLVPVAEDTVVAHPGSIESAFVRDGDGERPIDVLAFLRELGMTVVEVTREESMAMQACNSLCLGDRRIVCYDLATRVAGELRRRDVEVITIPGAELIKGTGGPRCMTRPVYS